MKKYNKNRVHITLFLLEFTDIPFFRGVETNRHLHTYIVHIRIYRIGVIDIHMYMLCTHVQAQLKF